MSPANTNTPIMCEPRYEGANFMGVHKVRAGNAVTLFWSKEDAEAAIRERGTMRTKWGKP
jgi:hypothetical protein